MQTRQPAGNGRASMCYTLSMKSAIILLLLLFPHLAWAEPSIVFQTEKHDFGSVLQGELLEYNFTFTNGGTDTLTIDQVNTS
jgi:hypothetical protein